MLPSGETDTVRSFYFVQKKAKKTLRITTG